MKRFVFIFLALLALVGAASGALFYVATGTPRKNAAFSMSFASTARRVMFINNRTAAAVYIRLGDSETTPTASATVYDLALDQNESEQVGRDILLANPIKTIGVFCADTTPTLRVTGY